MTDRNRFQRFLPMLVLTTLLQAGFAMAEPQTEQPASPVADIKPIELRASTIKTNNYPVDLTAVLKLVEDQNLLIAQGRKTTELQLNRLRQQQVALLPNITATYSENWQDGQQRFISGSQGGFISGSSGTSGSGSSGSSSTRRSSSSGGTQQFLQAQLGASWTIYPGGRNIYQILAAKRRKVSADFSLKETYQEQLSQAAQQYYKLLAAYQQKGVIIRSMIDAQEQVKLNQAKVQVGKGIPLDLSRAKTTYAQQQSNLVQAESTLLQAEQALLNRLNLDPTIHLVPNEMDALKKPLVPETLSMETLLSHALKTSPAIHSGEEELKALGYDYKTVRSDLIPAITLQTYMRGSGTELSNMQRSNSAGISINANLLQNMGLMVPLQMQEKKQLIQQKVLAQQALVRDVESQVMTAFLNSENYESAMEAAAQAMTSAQDSYDLALGRFQAGYGINVDVLDAQAQLATARSTLAQAVLNYNQAQVQLVQALGMATPAALTEGIQWQGNTINGKHTQ